MLPAAFSSSAWIGHPDRKGSLLVFLCAAAYVAAFLTACRDAAHVAGWLAVIPAVAAGRTWGLRAGFVTGLLVWPVNIGLYYLAGYPGWQMGMEMPGALLQSLAPLSGAICGRMNELGVQLLAERECRRESDRELQLTRRSLDATVRLLNEQATNAHRHLQAKTVAEEQSEQTQRELRRANIRLTRTALTDIDTELPNRRAALDRLQREWSAAQAKNRPLSCAVIRVDEPLKIRALHGPAAAAQVLRETLDIIRDSVRKSDELFSLGGDEFLAICPNTDLNAAADCIERVRAMVEVNTVVADDLPHHVTVSAGLAANCPELRSADDLLRAAQQALLDAQQVGWNRITCFSPDDLGFAGNNADRRLAAIG